ncbi:MAG: hypothetical protein HC884_09390 [Chloroflexaceae bacterium]|nr:hypothetical protein [Chloroflexaceae bacterium]
MSDHAGKKKTLSGERVGFIFKGSRKGAVSKEFGYPFSLRLFSAGGRAQSFQNYHHPRKSSVSGVVSILTEDVSGRIIKQFGVFEMFFVSRSVAILNTLLVT